MMTKTIKTTLLAASFLLLASCMDKGLQEDFNAVRLYSDGIVTKAGEDVQATQIVAGAQVGVFAKNATTGNVLDNGTNNLHTVTAVDSKMELNTSDLLLFPHSAPINVYAYAPYVESAAIGGFTFSVNSDQSTDENYIASDLLYAYTEDKSATGGEISLTFEHKMAKVKLFIYEGSENVNLEGATVTINNVPSSVQFVPTSGAVEASADKSNIKAAVFPAGAIQFVCSAVFPPHTFAKDQNFITINTGAATYSVALSADKEFEAGHSYTYGVIVKPINTEIVAAEIETWEEGHKDLNVGDGDIQSITFMSKYVEECAVAYYDFIDTDDEDNLKDYRRGQNLEFNYLVRPAEMAARLASEKEYLTDGTLTMTAYYADVMTKAFDNEIIDMTIENVSATDDGILTVVVKNPPMSEVLNQDFYSGKTSAKAALSVKLNETDYTTKFVPIAPKNNDTNVYAEKVSLNVTSSTISTGSTFQLVATISPSDVTTSGVTWTSSNTNIATVNASGLVAANNMQSGTTTITATAKMNDVNGLPVTATCEVEVTFAQPEVYIIANTSSVEVGGTVQLKYAALPVGIYVPQEMIWESNNPNLATVDSSTGLVTGVSYNISNQSEVTNDGAEPKYEAVTITLTADGKYKSTHELNVTPVYPKSLEFTDGLGTPLTMQVGENRTFSAKLTPDNLGDNFWGINWWIKDPSNAYETNKGSGSVTDRVSSYSFTASEAGTYVIHPRHSSSNFYNYIYAERIVNVEHVYYSSFAFAEDAVSFKEGVTYTPVINKSVSGSLSASYTSYTLTSANTGIASISGNSIVGVAAGTTTVTATYTDVDGNVLFTDTLSVTVEQMIDRVGWYFYSDGTCTAEYNSGKTVVGIVFSNYDATTDDPDLKADHPECCNGLVLALADVQTAYGPEDRTVGLNNTWQTVGYGSTKLVEESYNAGVSWPIIAALNNQTNYPNTSGWYIPSNQEIILLNANRDPVNTSLKVVGAGFPAMNNGVFSCYGRKYWTSTTNGDSYVYYAAWGNGLTTYQSGGFKATTSYYARFIFAF